MSDQGPAFDEDSGSGNDGVERAAEAYIGKGWPVVRVRPGGKKPRDDDWPNKNPQPRAFQASDNIGVNLARAGNLVDIDLDVPAARALASHSYFFADYPSFGREGEVPGHRLARCSDAPRTVEKFRFTKAAETQLLDSLGFEKTVMLELRGGEQTVFPPSRYNTDDGWVRVVWTEGEIPDAIPTVDWQTLRRKAGLLAFLSVIATVYPATGNRDNLCFLLAGTLVQAGLAPEVADALVVAVAKYASDEEAESMRANKATRAAERIKAGENVSGLPSLVEMLGLEVLEPRLRAWLQMPLKAANDDHETAAAAELVGLAPVPEDLPRRPWLVENLLLDGHVSMLTGRGGEGKSLFSLQIAIMVALEGSFAWWSAAKGKKVLYLSAEESFDEQQRRLLSACTTMNVDPSALVDRLFTLSSNDMVLVFRSPEDGKITRTPLYNRLAELVEEHGIGLVIVDPLVETHAYLDENSNVDMKELIVALRALARRLQISILAVHHSRKGGGSGDQDSARGGSALVNACRIVLTMERMTEDEHARINPPAPKEKYVRVTGAKSNYAGRIGDRWLEIESVQLRNGDFSPGLKKREFGGLDDAFDIASWQHRDAFFAMVRDGVDGRPYSCAKTGPKRRRLDVAMREQFHLDAAQARLIVEAFRDAGEIEQRLFRGDDRHNSEVWCVTNENPPPETEEIPF